MQVSTLLDAFTYRVLNVKERGTYFFRLRSKDKEGKRERDGRATRPVIYDILQTNKQQLETRVKDTKKQQGKQRAKGLRNRDLRGDGDDKRVFGTVYRKRGERKFKKAMIEQD